MARFVYGIHPVRSALSRHGREVRALMVVERGAVTPLVAEAERLGVPVQAVSPGDLDRLVPDATHQGVLAVVGDYPYRDLDDLLDARPADPFMLVLDGILDPQNLGSIFRSALVLGCTGLLLPRDRAAGVTPAVVRISAGATEHLPCARVTNLARTLQALKEAGLWVYGTVERGGVDPATVDLCGPLALVLGNEHKGLRPFVASQCDQLLTIPSLSPIASLNVAAASAAFCYEVHRQRRTAPKPAGTVPPAR